MKKVLSLVLVIAMVLSSMSFAFAGTFEDVTGDYEDAINTVVGLGIVTGYEDGTYRPEKVVTRAEMAKLIVETLGYGDLVAGSKSNFADTQGHWADAWIALAAGKGLVVGTGNGKFTPDRTVSYDEAITMVVRALGYTDDCNELKGMTWPTNFKVKAAELKITKDVVLASTGADRGGVAQLIYNALTANMVTVNTDGDVVYVKNGDTNKVLLNSLAKEKHIAKLTKEYLDEDSKLYAGDIVDLAPYMYQDIDVYVTDDKDEYVVYVADVNSDVLVGQFRTATSDTGKVNVRIDGKNKLYTLDSTTSTAVYYNGVEVDMNEYEMELGKVNAATATPVSIVDLHKADATFVLNDDDEIVGIIADKYTDAVRVSNEYAGKTKLEGYLLPLDDDDEVDYTKLTVTGAVDTLEDIQEDDVIVLFAGAGLVNAKSTEAEKLTIQVVRNSVEGKITETNSDDEYLIDGTYYPASIYAPTDVVEVGSEGTFFLDQKGAILDFEEGSETSPVDYAVVIDVLDGYIASGRTIVEPQIKLVNAAGEEITYDIKDTAKITKIDGTKVNLLVNGAAIGGEAQPLMDVNVLLDTDNSVVKYSVNSSKEITAVTLVNVVAKTASGTTTDTTKSSFKLANNVTVFNYKASDDEVEVVDSSKLGDDVYVLAKDTNKNGEINFLFVKGLGASDTFAFITSVGTKLNSDDIRVQNLTAYVNGEKKTYLASAIDTVTSTAIDSFNIVKLNMDGDVVDTISSAATILDGTTTRNTQLIANETEITRVSGNRIRIGSTEATYQWFTLADDVAVYVLDDYEFDTTGDITSVYNSAKVAGYAFDADNITDKVIEVLFIFD